MYSADVTRIDEAVARAADLFKILGAPVRVRLLVILSREPATVAELVEGTGSSQTLVSQHLRVMRTAGIVRSEPRGRERIYSVTDAHVSHIVLDAIEHAKESQMSTDHAAHAIHPDHDHVHGADCGHQAVEHGDHTDYEHDGHLHHAHGGHVEECDACSCGSCPTGCRCATCTCADCTCSTCSHAA